MSIAEHELEKMNQLLANGSTISRLADKFGYEYWEIYRAVSDYSLLGKKRSITNRLNKLKDCSRKNDRVRLIREIRGLLNDIYRLSKKNGEKLTEIGKIVG